MGKGLIWSATKKDFEIQTFCAGGSGGQHQNKTESGVRIIHKETGISAESREHRSQKQNKGEAFQRLAKKLMHHMFPRQQKQRIEDAPRVRTYHAVRNVVKDEDTGLTYKYERVMNNANAFAEMIDDRVRMLGRKAIEGAR